MKRLVSFYGREFKDGFTFHDLRHTFDTYMRKAGVPESVIMQITGHSTREMFDRYNTVDADDAKEAVRMFRSFLQRVGEDVDQGVDHEMLTMRWQGSEPCAPFAVVNLGQPHRVEERLRKAGIGYRTAY